MQIAVNWEAIKIIAEVITAMISVLISFAAFRIALLTYRSERKPVISLQLTTTEDWVILHVRNTGKQEARQLNIEYSLIKKSDIATIPYLPPDIIYTLKLEPVSVFKDLPISERILTFDYRYFDCYNKEHRRTGMPIQITW